MGLAAPYVGTHGDTIGWHLPTFIRESPGSPGKVANLDIRRCGAYLDQFCHWSRSNIGATWCPVDPSWITFRYNLFSIWAQI